MLHPDPDPDQVFPFLNEPDVRRLLKVAFAAAEFVNGLEKSGGIISADSPVGKIKRALSELAVAER